MKSLKNTKNEVFVVVGSKPWNSRVFHLTLRRLPGEWRFVAHRDELTIEKFEELDPRYVIFLHWSWRVAEEITTRWECICFHMTDLPYGRGGSPLQNLVLRGHQETVLTAFRMTEEIDAGPVYDKRSLSLSGNAEEILIRAVEMR